MAQVVSVERLRCSYRKATIIICTINVAAALYILLDLFRPVYQQSPSYKFLSGSNHNVARYTPVEVKRMKEAYEARRAVEPHELIKRVKEIQSEADIEISRDKENGAARQRVASELAQRLKELKEVNSQINQQALDGWRRKKLEEAKRREAAAKSRQGKEPAALMKFEESR